LGTIIPFMGFGPTIGGISGPFLAGYIFDSTGSYYFAFPLGATANNLATAFAVSAENQKKASGRQSFQRYIFLIPHLLPLSLVCR